MLSPAALYGRAPAPDRREARLAEAIGVTRLARITDLDRLGLEVVAAIRPAGHVLQVSNGKGRTLGEARAAALMEAAELAHAERPSRPALIYASAEELRADWGERVLWPDALGSGGELIAPELWGRRTVLAWVEGTDLRTRERVLVPACAVYCPPPDGPLLGPALVRWSTNGLAAHWSLARATEHALLEVVERSELARALPQGWTGAEVRRRMVPERLLARIAPRLLARLARARAEGLEGYLFDLRPTRPLGPQLAGALLFDPDGPVPLAAGYACAFDPGRALEAAFAEAAQSRLTEIHGAREDVEEARPEARALLELCRKVKPAARVGRSVRMDLVRRLARGGRVVRVVLSPRGAPHVVVKVIAQRLRVTELL